jgi:hypothetical protein
VEEPTEGGRRSSGNEAQCLQEVLGTEAGRDFERSEEAVRAAAK